MTKSIKLKPYARFLKNGEIVPGSLGLYYNAPSNGIWKEVQPVEYFNKTTPSYTGVVKATYPDATLASVLATKLQLFLSNRGVYANDTVLNYTSCSDDVNAPEFANIFNIGQTPPALNEFLGPFMGGGLAGYPHTGALALQAWQSHATSDTSTDGPLLLINMPHIGVSQQADLVAANDNVGRMLRRGKSSATADNTCGAVVTAAQWVMANLAGGSAPVRGAGVFANNDQYYTLATILYANRATLCSAPYNFVLDATKYSAGVKLATEYIRAKSFTDLKDTLIPVLTGQNNLYFMTGTFINVDDGYAPCINFNELWLRNAGTWTDLTTAFKATL
jgi:hypothetical protein